ncbi:alpha-E domain-containing protein [uncultured Paludibaculum sp.]|uniref:alpha-E domain-containing protein n=1 Tax=uncultured Paludibaculum sp. TaxID=1765020 RepID=UPI002AAB9E33|nr:alpha-E domain-containing protein [uncultured Paludibaculum sp.]
MLSRVADSLYWMARYLERAEHTARVVNVHMNLELEQPQDASYGRWARVLESLGMDKTSAQELDPHSLLHLFCFEQTNPVSILSCIGAARDNARQVREQISSEMWEHLNRLYHEVRNAAHDDLWTGDPREFLEAVKEGSLLFQGVTDSTSGHGEGWRFIQLGRFLERAFTVSTLVDVHFRYFSGEAAMRPDAGPDTADYLEWIGLLRCATAFEAYCKVYTASIAPDRVAEFLVLNETFPHSIRFSADRVQSALDAVSAVSPSRRGAKVQRVTGRWRSALSFAQIDEIIANGLHGMLADLKRQTTDIHTGIYTAFISYPVESALEA